MRCAKTPDGKPTSIGHKPPVIKPSEARVNATIGENSVVDLSSPVYEESTTLDLSPSDVVSDIPTSDLELDLSALTADTNTESGSIDLSGNPGTTAENRPEAPVRVARPEAPTPRNTNAGLKPGSSAGLKPSGTTGVKPGSAAGLKPGTTAALHSSQAANNADLCPNCKGKVRVGAVLCVQCGTAIKPAAPAAEPAPESGSGFFAKVFKSVVKPKENQE